MLRDRRQNGHENLHLHICILTSSSKAVAVSPVLCPGTGEGAEGPGQHKANGPSQSWASPSGAKIPAEFPACRRYHSPQRWSSQALLVCLKIINYKHPAPRSHVLTPQEHSAPGAHTPQMETLQSSFFSLKAAASSFFFSFLPFAPKTHRYIYGRANTINNVPSLTLLRDTDSKSQEFQTITFCLIKFSKEALKPVKYSGY